MRGADVISCQMMKLKSNTTLPKSPTQQHQAVNITVYCNLSHPCRHGKAAISLAGAAKSAVLI